MVERARNNELETWPQRHALAAQQMDSARTFVGRPETNGCWSATWWVWYGRSGVEPVAVLAPQG